MNKRLISPVLIILILISFISLISAESFIEKIKENENVNGALDKLGKIFGFENPEQDDKIFGLKIASLGNIGIYFIRGVFAGIYLWIVYILINYFERLKRLRIKKTLKENPFEGGKTVWFGLIAGKLYKVFLIGIAYAVLMQIPLLNRLIQIITLDLFLNGFWLKTFILSFEIGFGPSLIEYYWKEKTKAKYERAKTKARKIQELVRK